MQNGRVAELEVAVAPFVDPTWRAGLAALSDSLHVLAVRLVEDSRTIVALASRVPRSPGDERGGSPWTSFVREVAVARRVSDQAASSEIALAQALVRQHPQTVAELLAGRAPAHRARVLVQECLGHAEAVATAADEALAGRLVVLAPWRIRQEVRRLVLRVDADAAARREAAATAARTARRSALDDAQAEVTLTGPAVVVQRWWDALTDRARAVRAAGDPRGLGALRFDLAMTTDPRTAPGSDEVLTAFGAPAPAPVPSDARRSRPVQARIDVPAGTALGLTDEPGWLDGHGWISAPLSRHLLTVAELRKA
jgi:hypothetical protein